MTNGRIADFEIYAGSDLKKWGKYIAHGHWKNTDQQQTVRLHEPVTARYLRIVAKSEVAGHAFASAAEFDIVLQ